VNEISMATSSRPVVSVGSLASGMLLK